MNVIRASDVAVKKPEHWFFQKPIFGECFWDSYLHKDCEVVTVQPYENNPFKRPNA